MLNIAENRTQRGLDRHCATKLWRICIIIIIKLLKKELFYIHDIVHLALGALVVNTSRLVARRGLFFTPPTAAATAAFRSSLALRLACPVMIACSLPLCFVTYLFLS
jgi:hypothetical protein